MNPHLKFRLKNWLRRIVLGTTMGAAACGSPLKPTAQEEPIRMATPVRQPGGEDHGVPAIAPDGSIWQVCATQAREYVAASGERVIQRDHYLQREPCPETPID